MRLLSMVTVAPDLLQVDTLCHRIPNFIENGLEQFGPDLRSHSIRAVDADQATMKRNIRKLSTGPRIVRWTATFSTVGEMSP